MSRLHVSAIAHAIGAALLFAASTAQAVPLNNAFVAEPFLDTGLGGTTAAARPELAGTIIADTTQAFDFGALGITGTVQSRVVREDVSGTLDFSWRITVDPNSTGGVSAFRLIDFGYAHLTDADWRIDGLGSAAPYIGRLFNPADHPEGAINFMFVDPPVLPGDPAEDSNGSRFFFLHTDALFFAETASFDLLDTTSPNTLSPSYKTYAPAVIPEPSSVLLVGLGLAGTGLAGKRRRGH
jgi:PEP-CTERM motif